MKKFVIGFGIPRDRLTNEPAERYAYSDRACDRPGCNKRIRKDDRVRFTPGRKGYEHPFHQRDEERQAIDNGLVVAPRDRHGHRNLYLVFGGDSIFLKRVNVAEVGLVAAIGSTMGLAATRISYNEDSDGAR